MKVDCTIVRTRLEGLHPVTIRFIKVSVRHLCSLASVLDKILVYILQTSGPIVPSASEKLINSQKRSVVEFPRRLVVSQFDHFIPDGHAWSISGKLCQFISPCIGAGIIASSEFERRSELIHLPTFESAKTFRKISCVENYLILSLKNSIG